MQISNADPNLDEMFLLHSISTMKKFIEHTLTPTNRRTIKPVVKQEPAECIDLTIEDDDDNIKKEIITQERTQERGHNSSLTTEPNSPGRRTVTLQISDQEGIAVDDILKVVETHKADMLRMDTSVNHINIPEKQQ